MDVSNINQCALFVSSASKNPNDIVKSIIGEELIDVPYRSYDDDLSAYPWHINTKYYEADIHLCSKVSKSVTPQQFRSTVQAVTLFFDSNADDGLKMAESWLPHLNNYEAEVNILLCDQCHQQPITGISKLKAQEWCLQRGYELVELNPEIDEYELDQDFGETTGIKRIIQALHAHVWPHLTMKDMKSPLSVQSLKNHSQSELNDKLLLENLENLNLGSELNQEDIEEKIDQIFGNSLGDEDADFSMLFGQFAELKERVSFMPTEQRKLMAERVVRGFWKAIGGDHEEID